MEVKILISGKAADTFRECVGMYSSMKIKEVYQKNETLVFCIDYNDKYLIGDDLFELGRIFEQRINTP